VIDDCLKLTTYFGERQRVAGRFLADAQLDLFGHHEVATSIMLRGAEGFGLKHHLRSDRLLTLSEDLPLVSIAVDVRPRIEAVLEQLRAVQQTGLITLERARMLRDDIGPVALPEDLREATKLTVYVGRQERVYRVPAFVAVCELLHRRGVAGATVLLGVDGTAHGERERARFFGGNADVPMMIIAVGSGASIGRVLPELGALLRRPLVTLERVRVCKRDGELIERPPALPGTDSYGNGGTRPGPGAEPAPITEVPRSRPSGEAMWQKLMIFTSEGSLHDGQPVHRAIVQRLRRSGARGVTALRGVWGFAGSHPPHGDRLFQLGRRVPVLTVVVDSPERIAESFTAVDELTAEHGVVSSEMVPALATVSGRDRHGGLGLARYSY
jgi:PII-like signaling protein